MTPSSKVQQDRLSPAIQTGLAGIVAACLVGGFVLGIGLVLAWAMLTTVLDPKPDAVIGSSGWVTVPVMRVLVLLGVGAGVVAATVLGRRHVRRARGSGPASRAGG